MTSASLDDMQSLELGGSQEERVARRVAELFDSDAQFRAAAPVPEVIEAVCTPGLRLTEVLEAIVEGYADRPALGQRARELVTDAGTGRTSVRLSPQFDTISYREFWDRVRAIASAWRHDPAHPATAGDLVATIGFASADYLVVDMVCAYLGLVTVPLQHNAPARIGTRHPNGGVLRRRGGLLLQGDRPHHEPLGQRGDVSAAPRPPSNAKPTARCSPGTGGRPSSE
jgi:fatty acid CoA ligase FadD9